MASAQAVSLNGNAAQVMNNLFEDVVKPGFDSILSSIQGMGLDPKSLAGMLEKFNTTTESLGLVKNVFQGDIPDVISNLSNLTETFLEKNAAAQAQEMAQTMDQTPDMAPTPSPG